MLLMKTAKVADYIINWLKTYAEEAHHTGFVVGVSGGIDSAVTSALCAKTGLEVICLEMPIYQDLSQIQRARDHISKLKELYANVTDLQVDLTPVFESFRTSMPHTPVSGQLDLTLANSRARLRMTTLYYFAGLHKKLVVGTGNKVEDFGVGFYTKYGDGGVDLSPIADLVKSEVYALGSHLQIIDSIIQAPPTDGLFGDSRTDEDQLGASYDELEWAINQENKPEKNLSARQKEVIQIYKRLNKINRHKMIPIPVCLIPQSLRRPVG